MLGKVKGSSYKTIGLVVLVLFWGAIICLLYCGYVAGTMGYHLGT